MQPSCSPEVMDPRCNCKTGNCGRCGGCNRRGGGPYPLYGDSRYGGCRDIAANCDCRFGDDGPPPEYLCHEEVQFEDIADGVAVGLYGSNCQTEQRSDGNDVACKEPCRFDDAKPEYCAIMDEMRKLRFEDIGDGTSTGHLFPPCANGQDSQAPCRGGCNQDWIDELEGAKGYLCPDKQRFEAAPDGYLMKVDMCKGAPLYVTGWCRKAKSRRPSWSLCGGLRMYTKVCMRFNLCGGLRMSY
jgi:hypothetical protein